MERENPDRNRSSFLNENENSIRSQIRRRPVEVQHDQAENSNEARTEISSLNGMSSGVELDNSANIPVEEPNLDNPFALFQSVESLDDAVELFASRHGLELDVDSIKRAAHYERDDLEALNDDDFPEWEKTALRDEHKVTFWQQTRSLRSAVLVIGALSGICQGWTQSVLNGTNVALGEDFHLRYHLPDVSDPIAFGALSACVPLASGILGLFISDPIQNHWLGRRGAVAVSALVSLGATIGAVCARNIGQIIGCRILVGTALGAKASVIAPFLAELAPVHMRGAVLSTWQISDALGIFLGDIAWRVIRNFHLSPSTHWRFLSATILIPTIPLIIVPYMIPESWMFLMKTGEYPKALEAACSYQKTPIQGHRDIISSHYQMEAEGELTKNRKISKQSKRLNLDQEKGPASSGSGSVDGMKPLSERLGEVPGLCLPKDHGKHCPHSYHMKEGHFFKRLWHIIEDPRCRHALVSAGVVMLAQALCGINALAFFSSVALHDTLEEKYSLILALCFGAVSFGFGLLTPFLSDRFGRTTLVLLGLPIMAIFMFILAGLFTLEKGAKEPAVLVFAMLFTAVYSFTLGPAAFTLSAESFPSTVREAGMAICVFINMTSLGIQLLIYPAVTNPIGLTNSLCIYGCVDILSFIACFLVCVDTRDRSLEQLQYSFDLPLSVHCEYRLFYVLPELVKRCVEVTARMVGKRSEDVVTDVESIESDSKKQWKLIPFYRWARIQDPARPSVRQRFLRSFNSILPFKFTSKELKGKERETGSQTS